jgi:anti-sigma regulatory factor (Ser/Thr protein kinase)/anti-anti-sigma regulatory factor
VVDTRIELALETVGHGEADDAAVTADGEPADPGPPDAPVVVSLRGPLSEVTHRPLVDRLCGLLAHHDGVVVDVSGVTLTHSGAVHAFAEAVARAGEWPDVRLAIAGPDTTMASLLVTSRVAERVPVHPDVATALAHLDDRPEVLRGSWHFAVDPRAPGDARGHVRRVCRRWGIDEDAREAAEIVVTELVTNAVEHASSASVVQVWRRDRSLRLTVRDFDLAVLPEAHLPDPTAPRGRGLAMVAAVARTWGVEPHRDGKTVWAEMETA